MLTYHIYDGQSHGKWASPAPYLSDILDCQISSNPYQLPPLAPGTHPFRLLPETKTGVRSPSGFPTLQSSAFTPTYVHAKVNVSLNYNTKSLSTPLLYKIFGFPSKHENLIVKLPESQLHSAADPAVTNLIGTKCYVNWPYLVEAIVVGASDVSCKYHSPQHVYNKYDPLKSFNSPVNISRSSNNPNPTSAEGKTMPPTNDAINSTIDTLKSGDEGGKLPDSVPLELKCVPSTAEASGYFKKVKSPHYAISYFISFKIKLNVVLTILSGC